MSKGRAAAHEREPRCTEFPHKGKRAAALADKMSETAPRSRSNGIEGFPANPRAAP